MSFILDALKKSESDRQRQSGPALFEVRVAPPRNSLPLWAIGLATLLAVNLVIVAWVLLRRPAAPDQPAPAAVTAQTGNGGPQTQYPPGANRVAAGYPGPQQPFGPANGPGAVPVAGTAPGAPMGQTAGMTQYSGGMQVPGGMQPAGAMPATGMPSAGGMQSAQGAYPQQPSANTNSMSAGANDPVSDNPDDYAPAADAPPNQGFGNHVTRSTANGVPLYADVAQANHLPNLHLDLHVFAANPQQRFVMINTHKLREGDALPDGVHVDSITPDGAILSQNGTRFLLPRE